MSEVRMVYLAGPIDLDPTNHKSDWRKEASEMLKEQGICSFLPSEAFVWADGTQGAEKVIRINTKAIEVSDAVLFHLNEHLTVGTIREIQVAVDLKKPMVLWIDEKNIDQYAKSLYLAKITRTVTLQEAVTKLCLTRPAGCLVPQE